MDIRAMCIIPVYSGCCWAQCQGKLGMLQGLGPQRCGCDLAMGIRDLVDMTVGTTLFFILLICFGCAGSLLLHGGLPSCGEWGLLLAVSGASHGAGLSGCRARSGHRGCGASSTGAGAPWLQGPGAWAQPLWHRGFLAPRHVESSWARDRTRVLCAGR